MIELQGTAEGAAFSRNELNALLDLAEQGIRELTQMQIDALK
jgi:ribonuclease PH